MAIFASTTTSGYSDPLRAQSIKALEQRMKDQQAQMAAQQPDMASMATIPGGIGHVLGVVGDQMKEQRTLQAAAEGRNELAGVIAQGPKGENGNWAPEQLSVMARRSPELMEKFYQQQHEAKQLATTEGGLNTRNTATITGQNQRSDAEITGRKDVANLQEGGATARTGMTLASKEKEGGLDRAAASEQLESKQDHDTRMARLNAELAQSQKDRDNAFTSGQTGKAQEHEANITRLKSELASGEARQSERFQASQLNTKIASDEKIQGLQREAVAANLERQIAATSGDKDRQIKADENLARIAGELNSQRDAIKQAHETKLQTQAEKATSADVATKTGSAEKIAAAEAAEKEKVRATDPKRNEAIRAAETDYRKGLSHIANLEEASKILSHPGGIYTGALQNVAPGVSGVPGLNMLVDKEKAQRTSRYNTIVGEDAIRDMSETLKGSSTNFEMTEFKKMKNDPNISDAARAAQLQRVVKAARADLEAQARETHAIGGDTERVDKAMKGGADTPADPLEGRTANGPDGPIVRRGGKWVKQ